MRGFFGIGMYCPKKETNVGSLFRTAHILGASFVYTIGRRYSPQHSDTTKCWRTIPCWHFRSFDDFHEGMPRDAQLIGVELDDMATPLHRFSHPERAIYIMGAEDNGLPKHVLRACCDVVVLPGEFSMNVAVAGSIVLYDRHAKSKS